MQQKQDKLIHVNIKGCGDGGKISDSNSDLSKISDSKIRLRLSKMFDA